MEAEMSIITLKGRVIVAGNCKSKALVTDKPITFLGGVNPKTGTLVERGHDLYGQKITDKILCFPHGHGSTVGSYVIYALKKHGLAPRAMITENADTVVTVGAIIAEIPMLDQVDIKQIKTGDIVEIQTVDDSALVKVLREKSQCI
jgi:hypothetical protein